VLAIVDLGPAACRWSPSALDGVVKSTSLQDLKTVAAGA
jgi:hypothetical protein